MTGLDRVPSAPIPWKGCLHERALPGAGVRSRALARLASKGKRRLDTGHGLPGSLFPLEEP